MGEIGTSAHPGTGPRRASHPAALGRSVRTRSRRAIAAAGRPASFRGQPGCSHNRPRATTSSAVAFEQAGGCTVISGCDVLVINPSDSTSQAPRDPHPPGDHARQSLTSADTGWTPALRTAPTQAAAVTKSLRLISSRGINRLLQPQARISALRRIRTSRLAALCQPADTGPRIRVLDIGDHSNPRAPAVPWRTGGRLFLQSSHATGVRPASSACLAAPLVVAYECHHGVDLLP